MGWEQRGRRSYYYTAERVGGRVVKRYAGTGAVAGLAAQLDDINRQERDDERAARDAERAGLDALAELAPLNELADLLARAALLAAGMYVFSRAEYAEET